MTPLYPRNRLGLYACALILLAYGMGCATLSGAKAWDSALKSYRALATGMALYCAPDNPAADAAACVRAALASAEAEDVIQAVEKARTRGQATDAYLEANAEMLRASEPALEEVQPDGR